MTVRRAIGMAMSKEGIESKVIKDAFICLVENQRNITLVTKLQNRGFLDY